MEFEKFINEIQINDVNINGWYSGRDEIFYDSAIKIVHIPTNISKQITIDKEDRNKGKRIIYFLLDFYKEVNER